MSEFLKTAKERWTDPTPPFWKKMGLVLLLGQGGITAATTIEGIPQWAKILLVVVSGMLGALTGRFGSSNLNTRNK